MHDELPIGNRVDFLFDTIHEIEMSQYSLDKFRGQADPVQTDGNSRNPC